MDESLTGKPANGGRSRSKIPLILLTIGMLLGALCGAFLGSDLAQVEANYTGTKVDPLGSIIGGGLIGALSVALCFKSISTIVTGISKYRHLQETERARTFGRNVPLIGLIIGLLLGTTLGGALSRGMVSPVDMAAAALLGGFLGWAIGMILKDFRNWLHAKPAAHTRNPTSDDENQETVQ